ncbi:MAG: Hydrogenase transcriptional regulatory protein hupR1 [Alphaproteobacteria bacterium ADurb.BinA280]|nr:HDOD domain-containing protein [Xanthomonadales bacterium]MCC6506970.1 HDOD domain-containing protein [Aquimonas sp.]OPZ11126.1 MAG: Hydrogenase transcriptional regulatory protein hupR1 [Alphaproteobacteria bacterium ADurb.BinA280]
MSSPRIVFVDDERRVLLGIERMLFAMQRDWDTVFVESAEAALQAFDEGDVDVIVSDMRMPGKDGADLLREVQQRSPATLRFLLSGHTETAAAMRALEVAHQFLSKPCEPAQLLAAIDDALSLRTLLSDVSLRETIGAIEHLPSAPRVYARLNSVLQDPNTDARDISAILAQDPVLTAKLLKMANSAYFPNTGRALTDIRLAVMRIGSSMIRTLVLATEVFSQPVWRADVGQLQHQALMTSLLAERIARGHADVSAASVAGLLANLGKLFDVADDSVSRPWGYGEVGAYLLGLWGFPLDIVHAVAYHRSPRHLPRTEFNLLGITHVANSLISGDPLDQDYVHRCGQSGALEKWRETAESIQQRANA